jgi:hypothetical protein
MTRVTSQARAFSTGGGHDEGAHLAPRRSP